jgi:uncharacterized protein YndB with AHSA1/START domain
MVGTDGDLSLHRIPERLACGGEMAQRRRGTRKRPFTVEGEYVEVDSPRLLVYSWVASWTGDVKTTVRWDLEPVEKGTLLRIRHGGLSAHPEVAHSYRGWPRMLGWLQSFIEKGETIEMRKPLSA